MGIAYHNVYAPDGAALNLFDRVTLGTVTVTYPAATAGASSTIVATWNEPIVTGYTALISPIEDCTYFISARTTTSCLLTVNARLATNTLSGGAVELLLIS
jgi:hypothetical protein